MKKNPREKPGQLKDGESDGVMGTSASVRKGKGEVGRRGMGFRFVF